MSHHVLVDRGPGQEWWRPEPVAPARADGGLAFWATIGFLFTALTAPQHFFPELAPLRIALLIGAVAIAACVADRLGRQQPLTVPSRETRLAAGLAGWAILSVPLSYSPMGSVLHLLGYFRSLAVFWLLSNTVSTPARLRQLAWAISLMTVPMAGSALVNFVSASFIPYTTNRIVGFHAPLVANPNDLALMLNLMLPLSAALLLTGPRPAFRALLITIILLNILAVIVTFSRGGFLTLATIVGAYVWKLRRRPERSWAWAALVLALVCVPFLPSGYLDRISTITDADSDPTGSAQERRQDIGSAAKFVLANPIVGAGIGVGALALAQENDLRAIHNVYLEYAVDLSIPGLVLFLLLLVECVKSVARVQERSAEAAASRDLLCLAEGIQVSLLAFSVGAVFHPVAYTDHFYYFAGLAVAVKAIDAARDRNAPRMEAVRIWSAQSAS